MDGIDYGVEAPMWSMSLKSCVSQFCGVFSEFGTYLAPTYHHDRCERYKIAVS